MFVIMETKDAIHLIDATGLIIVQALLIHWSPLRDVVLGIFRFFHFSSGTRSIPEVREGGFSLPSNGAHRLIVSSSLRGVRLRQGFLVQASGHDYLIVS